MEITETDEAGNVIATYVQSPADGKGTTRVDVIRPTTTKSIWQRTLDIFLPAGYPHSVTEDYMEYQFYDSIQAFSSSIAGLLSSRAVLSSVGVGDASASPTAALFLSIFQESIGRLATILFAHRLGTAFEPECKMYRLLADVLNDIAFILDCLSPMLPKPLRVIVLSSSSVLRALCGVAAGSAKASLSAHFARWGNLGELNAKDSSQETVISLLGMLAGSLVVSRITTPFATWTVLILLLAIHLETNRRAVRAVVMNTLNRQRATLVFHQLTLGSVSTPQYISKQEVIFERDGILRDRSGRAVGSCLVGATFSELLRAMASQNSTTESTQIDTGLLTQLLYLYRDQAYLLWYTTHAAHARVIIVIKASATQQDVLVAWWQAVAIAMEIADAKLQTRSAVDEKAPGGTLQHGFDILARSIETASTLMKTHEEELRRVGWDMATVALETTSNTRMKIANG